MTLNSIAVLAALSCAHVALSGAALGEEDFKLPPEVTPSMRAACEADVRRMCVKPGSTLESVK